MVLRLFRSADRTYGIQSNQSTTDMSRLVNHRTKHKDKTFVCDSCLHPHPSPRQPPSLLSSPSHPTSNISDPYLRFKSMHKQHMVPFYLVCDFESFVSPVDTDDVGTEEDTRGMRLIDEHKMSVFCCYHVTKHEAYQTPPFVYPSPDLMDVFYTHIMKETEIISAIVRGNVDMLPLSQKEEREFKRATVCGNCAKPFTNSNQKVRHQCHISGRYSE